MASILQGIVPGRSVESSVVRVGNSVVLDSPGKSSLYAFADNHGDGIRILYRKDGGEWFVWHGWDLTHFDAKVGLGLTPQERLLYYHLYFEPDESLGYVYDPVDPERNIRTEVRKDPRFQSLFDGLIHDCAAFRYSWNREDPVFHDHGPSA